MARIVVIGDLMTDTVAHATLPLARGSDTPAKVTTHGGGSGANTAAWLAADGADVAFVGRRGADIACRNRDMELMGYGVDARLVMDPERPTGTCVVMVTHKGERTMLSDPGANAALAPDDLPHDLFVPGAHLHVSGYTLLSRGVAGRGPGRAGLLPPGRHVGIGRRGLGRAAGAGGRRAVPRAVEQRRAAVRERRAGQGADRPGRRRAGRPGAHRVVSAGRHQARARTARCSTPTAVRQCGCRRRRSSGSSTAPARATRSSPGSSLRGWTRSRRPRPSAAAAGSPRTRLT